MSQSLRVAPPATHPTTTTNTQSSKFTPTTSISRGAPSAPGLPDTLRLSHSHQQPTTTPQLTSTHPLESRLTQWTRTQQSLQQTLLRRTFGIALPLRMSMEQHLVAQSDTFRPSALGPPARVHDDILKNRDTSIDWEDIYAGQDGLRGVVNTGGDGQGVGWTEEMEGKIGMGKW